MATFTLSIIGYLYPFPTQTGQTLEQVKAALHAHRELYPWRVRDTIAWAEQAQPGQIWQTQTDLQESDQADVYLIRE